MATRKVLLYGSAGAGGVAAYYLYKAGGNTSVAEKDFERMLQDFSALMDANANRTQMMPLVSPTRSRASFLARRRSSRRKPKSFESKPPPRPILLLVKSLFKLCDAQMADRI
jgi:hypothetical protein